MVTSNCDFSVNYKNTRNFCLRFLSYCIHEHHNLLILVISIKTKSSLLSVQSLNDIYLVVSFESNVLKLPRPSIDPSLSPLVQIIAVTVPLSYYVKTNEMIQESLNFKGVVHNLIARLRNHNATDHDNVDFRSFFKNLYSKLGKLM